VAPTGSARAAISRLRRAPGGQGVVAVLARGATGSAAVHGSGVVLALVAQLVLARLLPVPAYGHYVVALTWIMLLTPVCRLGFQNSLIRFTAQYRTSGGWGALRGVIVRSAQVIAGAAALVGALLAGGAVLLAAFLPADQVATMVLAGLTLVPLALVGVPQGVLQGYRRPALAQMPFRALLHAGILGYGAIIVGLLAYRSGTAAMMATLLATITILAVSIYWSRGTARNDLRAHQPVYHNRYWLAVSLPMTLIAAMNMLLKRVDTVMLGAIAGSGTAALYFPATRLAEFATFGLMSANAIVAPMISELHTQGDRRRLQRLLTFAALGISTTTLIIAAALVVGGEWGLSLFGPAFTDAYAGLVVLLGGQMVSAFCGPVGYLMTMTGHERRAAWIHASTAIANVALNALLIPLFGLLGAAIATSLSIGGMNLWMGWEVIRREGLNPSLLPHRLVRRGSAG